MELGFGGGWDWVGDGLGLGWVWVHNKNLVPKKHLVLKKIWSPKKLVPKKLGSGK